MDKNKPIIPTRKRIEQLHRKYAPNEHVYDLVFGHCEVVAEIAMTTAEKIQPKTPVNLSLLEAACLLHDIGSYAFIDEKGNNSHNHLYPHHAMLGAKLLEDDGIDPAITSIIATHVMMGISKEEIIARPWPLPERDYVPENIEGELLCYADRFHSKWPIFNSYEYFIAKLRRDLPVQAEKFDQAVQRFGLPDIQALAAKYGHPIQ